MSSHEITGPLYETTFSSALSSLGKSSSNKSDGDGSPSKMIEKMYDKSDQSSEFEVIFFKNKKHRFGMSMEKYLKFLQYMTFRSQNNKSTVLKNIVNLDVSYTDKTKGTYRVTLSGIKTINRYAQIVGSRKNHVIFSTLVRLSKDDPNIQIIKKVRKDVYDLDDYDLRFRLASELKPETNELNILQNLSESTRDSISFRYKQRISLILIDQKELTLSIDLTNIKSSNNYKHLETVIPTYELEIDLSSHTKSLPKKYLDTVYEEIGKSIKVIEQSNYIVSNTVKNSVVQAYNSILNTESNRLGYRETVTLEIQHVVDKLPNKYAVTDKADGVRAFLLIHNLNVFIIFKLLDVVHTGIALNKVHEKYNNTILDGEYVFIKQYNKHLFLAFDCLYKSGQDIRPKISFLERLEDAKEVIQTCFVLKGHKGQVDKFYNGEFSMTKILDYYNGTINKYIQQLNEDLGKEDNVLIRTKFFIPTLGGQNNEIFKYSALIWNKYTKDANVHCPYILDGLVYHPLNQKYASSKESEYFEYKWKPQEKNSIDFYITFERYRATNKIITIFDNSSDPSEQIHGKPYKIVKLQVGKSFKGIEKPINFEPEKGMDKHLAYICLVDGEARDIEGNILMDDTVVEFYYNNDPNIPEKYRWVPMRTRYDKTESVQRYGKEYGNYYEVAYKNWRSIKNPFSMNDINILSTDTMYDKHNKILRGKIDHSIILSEQKENKFNVIRNTLGAPMRNFKNWLESIIIYTYVNYRYEPDQKPHTVLDMSCGMGRDMMKYYYCEVALYVGLDSNLNSLMSPVKGAVSRYNQLRKTHPKFPKMNFIHANASVPLTYDEQLKTLGGMSDLNRTLMNQYFSPNESKRVQFSRVTCQYGLQAFLENTITWENFMKNLSDYLAPEGYFICTTIDADVVTKLLSSTGQYTVNYTNTKGEQVTLFDLVKKYTELGDVIGVGKTFDFYDSFESHEGVYITEYLVQKKFIIQELTKKCGLQLIETDLYQNQQQIHSGFFRQAYKHEANEKTLEFFNKASEFFTIKTDIVQACSKLIGLYRYYIFRKVSKQSLPKINMVKDEKEHKTELITKPIKQTKKAKPTKPIKSKQKGGEIHNLTESEQAQQDKLEKIKNVKSYSQFSNFNEATGIFNPLQFIKKDVISSNNYSFANAVHDILVTERIIPNNSDLVQFHNDIKCHLYSDKELNDTSIKKLINSLKIYHELTDSESRPELALDRVQIFVVRQDCDGDITVDKYGGEHQENAIIFFDGQKYYPIYEVEELQSTPQLTGLFKNNHKIIRELLTYKTPE